MKQKLLLLAILITFSSWGKEKNLANPSIGILLSGYPAGAGQIYFNISIKNTGEETLTNVYVMDVSPFGMPMQFMFGSIASIAPGEEVTGLQAIKYGTYCYDQSQVLVHATTTASTDITDLSADPYAWFNPGVLGSYYNDLPTDIYYVPFDYARQEGIYNDLNGNSIVDVGDAINYSYELSFENATGGGTISDNNAVVTNPVFSGNFYTTTGIHYLTQAEVDLGYVYNSSSYWGGSCGGGGSFQDQSYCPCPNPVGANIITPLTSLLPNRISGKVKYNTNSDNCATGSNFMNRRIATVSLPYTYASYTDATGNYHILIPNTGEYTTSALTNLGATFSSNPVSVAVTSSGSGIDYNNTDFCISSAAGYADLRVTMFNVNEAIPGNAATYRIYYSNNGSTSLNGSIELTYDNGKLALASASPAQNSATANTLTWNYANLLPFETRYISLSMNVGIPPTVNTNNLLNFIVNGTPIADDVPSNNSLTWNQTVRSSFDPNDKTVIEGNTISLPQASNYLTYVTRFQNTGTANATTVVIKDTLDPKLDWDTFEPIASSHSSNIQIQNGNAVTYTFSNIDLAYESADEAASHGWMAYRIKPKNDVIVGDIMSSNSNIYFDYNSPILTNTVNTQITALATTDFIKNNFAVFPNPASNYLMIKSQTDSDADYEIIDINGKLLLTNTVESMIPININSLQSGFYFLNIKTSQGKATYKFIKN